MKSNLLFLLLLLFLQIPLTVNSQSLPAQAIKVPHFENFLMQPRIEMRFSFYPTDYQLSYLARIFPQEITFKIVLNHLTDKPVLSGAIGHFYFNYPLSHSLLNAWHVLAIELDFQKQTLDVRLNQQIIAQENNLSAFTCQTADLVIGGYIDLYKNYRFIGKLDAFKLNQIHQTTKIITEKKPFNYVLWMAILSSALLFWFIFYKYQNRVLTALLKQPAQFLHYPLADMPHFYKKFHNHKKFNLLLERLQTDNEQVKKILFFIKLKNPLQRCHFLFKKLPCSIQPKDEQLNNLFYIEFTEEFPLNLHHLYVYFPVQTHTTPQILAQLQQHCAFETVLIIHHLSGVSTSQFIFIKTNELTQWLLHKNPLLNFCHILANNMELKQLSPFQNYGTVYLHNVFLTRQSILKKLLANPMQNYALIGGRQLGKTSILKFLLHYYQNKSIECQYIIVRDNSLLQLLTPSLKTKKKQLILLDEADDFIAHDRAKGYPILQHLQNLNMSGKIAFVFAGHYELFTEWHSTSPYQDFAQAILIETFNTDTCQSFIENSLQYLNCRFVEQELLTMLIKTLGGRPNLIISACQALLSLGKQQFEKTDLEQVLNGLKPNLLAQVGLSAVETEQILEKILILTALFTQQYRFSQQDTCRILEHFGFCLSESLIQTTIQRLCLAGIFRPEKAEYILTIPLLQQVFLQDSLGLLLAQNITQYKARLLTN